MNQSTVKAKFRYNENNPKPPLAKLLNITPGMSVK